MKKLNKYLLLISILFIGCSVKKSNSDCVKFQQIPNGEICLPKIDALVECSQEVIIKEALEETNGKENNIIGFYIPYENHSKLDSILSLNYNNYFQISLHKHFRDKKISRTTYQEFVDMMNNNFIVENCGEIEVKMKKLDLKQEVNKPEELRKYKLHKNVNCIEMAFKIDGLDEKIITIMSLIYLKNSIISTGYYKHFNGMKSIEEAEKTNEKLINKLLNSNK